MMQTTTRLRSTSLTRSMRLNKLFSVITTAVTLFFFMSTWYIVPSAHAAGEAVKADKARKQYHPRGRSDEEKLSNTLQDIKERVVERRAQVRKRVQEESDVWQGFLNLFGMSRLAKEDLDRLDAMAEQAELLNQKALQGFDAIEQELIDKGLPEEILQRHRTTVDKYRTQYRRFREKLQNAQTSQSLQDQDSALGDLDEFMGKQQFKRRQQPFDPNKLPFGTPDPKKTREPVTDPQELNRLLGMNTETGLIEKVADAFATPAYADPVDGPTLADLAETIDVQITPEIEQLADDLNNSPVEIYTWVHNNIRFIPSYGSIQGSKMTLLNRQGNAIDTASLLIALLRASNIPARYVYGTVDIPVEQVMNWVGGVFVPEAAQQLISQGGIPNIAMTEGGRIAKTRMEHTWVEAYIDYEPSRGVKNSRGDSWVPMDASFKQYEFIEGIDLKQVVPFDTQALIDDVNSSVEVNETEGWVQGLTKDIVAQHYNAHYTEIQDYIANNSDLAVLDLFGYKKIPVIEPKPLAAGLPYQKVSTQMTFSEVPDNLRHKFKFELYDNDPFGGPIFSVIKTTPELAGKKLSLSFGAATKADADFLIGSLPEPNQDGSPLDPSQYPQNLPGYLIKLKAEFAIDGETVASGGQIAMGTELQSTMGLWEPSKGWNTAQNNPIAGEYHAIALDLQGVALRQIEDIEQDIESLRENVESGQYDKLKKHDLIGHLLYNAILSYFAMNDAEDVIAAQSEGFVIYRHPSYGVFQTNIETQYLFGIFPRNVSDSGLQMDVDNVANISVEKNNDHDRLIEFRRLNGYRLSAMEHQIPQMLFTDANNPNGAISAVKALTIASQEGQRIYTITSANLSSVNSLAIGADVKSEIIAAVNAGKEVTVSQTKISFNDWSGVGYIIFDPLTGSGAYKISGGANGAFWSGFFFGMMFAALMTLIEISLAAGVASGGLLLIPGLVLAAALIAAIIVPIYKYHMKYYGNDPKLHACWLAGATYGAAATGVFGALNQKAIALLLAAIIGGAVGGEIFDFRQDATSCL